MIEFEYPHTHLVAGVDEVGRGPLIGAVVTGKDAQSIGDAVAAFRRSIDEMRKQV